MEGVAGEGEVTLNLKAISINWIYCMNGSKDEEVISPVG